MTGVRRAADLVVLTRLMSCAAAAGEVLLGAHLARGDLGVARRPVAVACVAVLLIAAAGNVANDLHDVPVDTLNKPWRPLPSGRMSGREAAVLALAMAVTGMALAWTLGPAMGAVATGLAVLAVGYSTHLKGTVLLGNATVALVAASPVLYGAQVNGGLSASAGMAWSIVFLFMGALEVLKTVADREADARVRLVTVATRLGAGRALRVVHGLLLLYTLVALAPVPLGLASNGYTPAMLFSTVVPVIVAQAIVHRRHGEQPIRMALWVLRGAWFPGLLTLGLLR
jgi:geranylgeranylglycerol-phosphate geranylgeranyltransferase